MGCIGFAFVANQWSIIESRVPLGNPAPFRLRRDIDCLAFVRIRRIFSIFLLFGNHSLKQRLGIDP